MPSASRLVFTYFGNVVGRPAQIVNVASVVLPADGTLVDPEPGNNSATDTDLLDFILVDGFEAPFVNGPAGSLRIPGNALRSVLDEVSRPVLTLQDRDGLAARVYARVLDGTVEYALGSRDASGRLRFGGWQRSASEPTLRWVATEDGLGWRVVSVTLD